MLHGRSKRGKWVALLAPIFGRLKDERCFRLDHDFLLQSSSRTSCAAPNPSTPSLQAATDMKIPHPSSLLLLTSFFNMGSHGYQLVCLEPRTFARSQRPLTANCAKAIIQHFSYSPEIGQFHSGGALDIFRLPRTATVGDCMVTVDIDGRATLQSSWTSMWTLASTLSAASALHTPRSGLRYEPTTGGSVVAGIRLTTGKPPGLENMTESTTA